MTREQVRSKTERIREFAALPFLLMAVVSVLGVVVRPAAQPITGGPINPGDVAWMLTATGLVLLMTPGLSFFYGGVVRRDNLDSAILPNLAALAGPHHPCGGRRLRLPLRHRARRGGGDAPPHLP